jgi:hypothetical protein
MLLGDAAPARSGPLALAATMMLMHLLLGSLVGLAAGTTSRSLANGRTMLG